MSPLVSVLFPSPGAAWATGQHQRHLCGGANGQQSQPEHGADRSRSQSPVRGDCSPQPRGGGGLVQEQSKDEETGVIRAILISKNRHKKYIYGIHYYPSTYVAAAATEATVAATSWTHISERRRCQIVIWERNPKLSQTDTRHSGGSIVYLSNLLK